DLLNHGMWRLPTEPFLDSGCQAAAPNEYDLKFLPSIGIHFLPVCGSKRSLIDIPDPVDHRSKGVLHLGWGQGEAFSDPQVVPRCLLFQPKLVQKSNPVGHGSITEA